MKLYLAFCKKKPQRAYKKRFPKAKINALISYGRRERDEMALLYEDRSTVSGLILDSGCWSLNQNRKKYQGLITIQGYSAFLRNFADKVDFYFNFDEDFTTRGFNTNLAHQLRLEHEGFKPVPVIHDCYGPEVQYYVDRGYKMLAIGSGELQFASLDEMHFIMEPFRKHGIKVHFLGRVDYEKLAKLPVYSCDSSTWTQAATKSNYALFWNPARSGFDKTDKIFLTEDIFQKSKGRHHTDHPFRRDFEEYLHREFGFYLEDLVGKGTNVFLNRQIVNIHYFLDIERRVNEKHVELGFSFD